ncbi:hypothetical protein [Bacillus cereus]|uniref:hypothetical protein n=1 Tax=Bacillus cereus TaxID=1396 RepID=UPI00016B5B4C|nr:hypothetical protein [Bacillus cereus]EDZ49843.1 hypothetical protein BCAH1134_A0013 [Bacillus cereus AH1134]
MEIPKITLSPKVMREILTELINEFIRIEKSVNGETYWSKSSAIRGQITLLTSFLNEKWEYKESEQSYFEFLIYIVNKYELKGVWRIEELIETKKPT